MITVIGATGFTGGLIVAHLNRDRVPMRITGRDRFKLSKLAARLEPPPEIVEGDVRDDDMLKRAMEGSKVIINCAGPFTDLGLSVVRTAIDKRVHYLDITGEQPFIREVINVFKDRALLQNCTVVPSCAFEYAVADAAASLINDRLGGLDDFDVTYCISGFYTSRGTKLSVMKCMEAPAYQLRAGRLIKIAPGEISKFTDRNGRNRYRFPFPGGEVCLLPLHTRVANISTYIASSAPYVVLSASSKFAGGIARSPLKKVVDFAISLTGSVPSRHKQTTFALLCRGKKSGGGGGREGADNPSNDSNDEVKVEIIGKDPYSLTAKIVTQCALSLIDANQNMPRGVVSASMLKGYAFIKLITEEEGVVWRIVEDPTRSYNII